MDTSWQLRLDSGSVDGPWARLSHRMGGDIRVIVLFGAVHLALAVLALQFREAVLGNVIAWPTVGVLFLALWLADRRLWVPILLVQLATELAVLLFIARTAVSGAIETPLLHSVVGVVGAVMVRRMLAGPQGLRVVAVLQFMAAGAIGSVAGALLWTAIAIATGDTQEVARRALQGCMADVLGLLAVVPPVLAWMLAWRFRKLFSLVTLGQRLEVAAVLVVQIVTTAYVFSASGPDAPEQLRFPVLVVPGLIYAAFRLPPRWSTLATSVTILEVAGLMAHGGNPLGIERTLTRLIWVQTAGVTFVTAAVSLLIFVIQSRIALASLAASEARYRSFIELSSEAVWRIELSPPMPVSLAPGQQLEWLRNHARIAESSRSSATLVGKPRDGTATDWSTALPWVQLFETALDRILHQGYHITDLQLTLPVEGRQRTYLTSFDGVVEDGHLERIWGVARDVTELLELNSRLLREQELLRSYAQRIVSAEEGARRNTAVDLHDGIGQELVAMGMVLTTLAKQLTPEQRAQIDELRGRLHRVQQRTRDLISDLSPPGLYDLGLEPALQWLVVYLRTHNHLQVQLDCAIDEVAVSTELRVMVFKMVRELLRNVMKHARTDRATVQLRGTAKRLTVVVSDAGCGFEWHPENLTGPPRGLGLWSIATRMAEMGGTFGVNSEPGRGARFTFEIPLRGS